MIKNIEIVVFRISKVRPKYTDDIACSGDIIIGFKRGCRLFILKDRLEKVYFPLF